MSYNIHNGKRDSFFCSESLFPQTIEVIKTKAHAIGVDLHIGKVEDFPWQKLINIAVSSFRIQITLVMSKISQSSRLN